MLFLDTHAAVWLYADPALIPRAAAARIDSGRPYISPMAVLEIQYLFEVGRIKADSSDIIAYLSERLSLSVEEDSFAPAVLAARNAIWTRDPFARIIASHARILGALLISKDKLMASGYRKTVWEY